MEKEPVINTALPGTFTLTDPECGSGEGFTGLFGFRQEKDDLDVARDDAPFLDTNVPLKIPVAVSWGGVVCVMALCKLESVHSAKIGQHLHGPGSVAVEVKSETDWVYPHGVGRAAGEADR